MLRLAFVTLIVSAGIHSEFAQAQIDGLGDNGWHTWQVEAVAGAPDTCCFTWKNGEATQKQCNLDQRKGGFSTSDRPVSADDGLQIYALIEAGTVNRVRAFSSSCPVASESEIIDLGRIETEASVNWLRPLIGGDATSNVIAAIAVHDGATARNALLDSAKVGNDEEIREDAIFWMAQVRLDETGDEIKGYIFNDDSAAIREHAAFAYSQSKAVDIADTLIRQGENDRKPDVRSHAWFWLAQTEAAESETAIHNAMLNDENEDVREEAVFALSQLPEDRAVKALAAILEDKALQMDIREQAMFWLAQTESDEAFEYIDELLSDN